MDDILEYLFFTRDIANQFSEFIDVIAKSIEIPDDLPICQRTL